MRISNYDIKRIVRSGKGHVVFLTTELKEVGAKDRVIVSVEKNNKGKFIMIRPFSLKK